MSVEEVIERVKDTVKSIVPPSIRIMQVEFEGPTVVIYTRSVEEFAGNSDLVRHLAQALRRRVAIRPDPAVRKPLEESEKIIKEIIPADAQVTDTYFEHENGEVYIDALSPGLAIGRHGAVLNEIRKMTGWVPKVARTPPIASKTIGEIRGYLRTVTEERKEWLRKMGRRISRETRSGENWARITMLGGFREIGRSAILLSTKDSRVLVDCGVKFAEDEGTPFLNAPEVLPFETIDAVVITHAHLDHSGLLPMLFKYGFDGAIYCTPPTRDLMSLLQIDYLKVAYGEAKRSPYDSSHVREAVKHTIPLRYMETTDITPDIRITFHNAGHILGSALCHFHIGEGMHNIVLSGDIKYERTWLFDPATDEFPRMETLVIESTYGGHNDFQPTRAEAGEQIKDIASRTLTRKGKLLVPVFAVGRSQEVMLVLEELIRTKAIPEVPIYLDGMIWEATAIHTAYPEYLNTALRNQIFQRGDNPFLSPLFKRVENSSMRSTIVGDSDPCIVLATSGMLTGGPVIEYLREWAPDPNNTLLFVGFQADGTLGRRIQRGHSELEMPARGRTVTIPFRMGVETVDGFSGHSDRRQLMDFIQNIRPRPERVIVGHGEESKSLDLASSLYQKFHIETRAPMNLEAIRLR